MNTFKDIKTNEFYNYKKLESAVKRIYGKNCYLMKSSGSTGIYTVLDDSKGCNVVTTIEA